MVSSDLQIELKHPQAALLEEKEVKDKEIVLDVQEASYMLINDVLNK